MTKKGKKITIELDEIYSKLLIKSGVNSDRSMRSEATIRIKDHLDKFASIARLGETNSRTNKD